MGLNTFGISRKIIPEFIIKFPLVVIILLNEMVNTVVICIMAHLGEKELK